MERRQIDGPAAGVLARCPRCRRLHRGPQRVAGPDRLRADPGRALRHASPCSPRTRGAVQNARRVAVWKVSWTPPTSARFSAGRRHWAWTPCCSRRPAATRSAAVPSASAWARCSRCRGQRWVTALPTGPRRAWPACTRWALKRRHGAGQPRRQHRRPGAAHTRHLAIVLGTEGDGLAPPRLPTVTTPSPDPHAARRRLERGRRQEPWRSGSCFCGECVCGPRRRMRNRAYCPRTVVWKGRLIRPPPPPSPLGKASHPSICHKNITKVLRPADRNVGGACCFDRANVTIIIQASQKRAITNAEGFLPWAS